MGAASSRVGGGNSSRDRQIGNINFSGWGLEPAFPPIAPRFYPLIECRRVSPKDFQGGPFFDRNIGCDSDGSKDNMPIGFGVKAHRSRTAGQRAEKFDPLD